MPRPPSNVALHELVDLISAVQHVIIDTLSELSSEEISRLKGVGSMTGILVSTTTVMEELQKMDPSMTVTMDDHISSRLRRSARWNAGPGFDVTNRSAQGINEYLKEIPGMTHKIIVGLQNPNKVPDGDVVQTDIAERLAQIAAQLKVIIKQVDERSRLGGAVSALYWNIISMNRG